MGHPRLPHYAERRQSLGQQMLERKQVAFYLVSTGQQQPACLFRTVSTSFSQHRKTLSKRRTIFFWLIDSMKRFETGLVFNQQLIDKQ